MMLLPFYINAFLRTDLISVNIKSIKDKSLIFIFKVIQ